ncbi:MAG: RMD1 family protein [Bacteroidia bacterium]|nr:RMD1 family protein [Bacteroidia bacterium]
MENSIKLTAILVANQIDMKGLKSFLKIKPTSDSSTELFYGLGENRYQYYFNYGVIVFSGHLEDELKQAVDTAQPFLKNPTYNWLRDEHKISIGIAGEMKFEFDRVIVDHLDDKVFRIAMLNLAQSVALDHYHEVSENLLTEIKGFTNHLEQTGKLSINRRNMLKFIGKALNTQNEIADNIYIFDGPEQVWDDEYLDSLHKGLMKYFDLRVRFSEIEYTLRIIESNHSVFREISNQRQSNMLEWIIIFLIMVEVINLILSKLL